MKPATAGAVLGVHASVTLGAAAAAGSVAVSRKKIIARKKLPADFGVFD